MEAAVSTEYRVPSDEQPETTNHKPPTLLPLDGERAVTFKDRGWPYTFYFLRITADDWRELFRKIVIETERQGKEVICRSDADSAAMDLVRRKVDRIEGYRMPDDRRFEEAFPNWKELIPYRHLRAAATALTDCGLAPVHVHAQFTPGEEEVVLEAAWGMESPGKMRRFTRLVHRFREPSQEQVRRYRSGASETRIAGSRRQRTIYGSKNDDLVRFYDDLIVSVEGYALTDAAEGGRATRALQKEDIVREMDAYHKFAAAQGLFAEPDPEGVAALEEEAA